MLLLACMITSSFTLCEQSLVLWEASLCWYLSSSGKAFLTPTSWLRCLPHPLCLDCLESCILICLLLAASLYSELPKARVLEFLLIYLVPNNQHKQVECMCWRVRTLKALHDCPHINLCSGEAKTLALPSDPHHRLG